MSIEPTGGAVYQSTIGFDSLPRGVAFCLDFWYQAFVSSDTTLDVYMQNTSSPAVLTWRRAGTTARDQWTHALIDLGTIRASTLVTISGKMSFFEIIAFMDGIF